MALKNFQKILDSTPEQIKAYVSALMDKQEEAEWTKIEPGCKMPEVGEEVLWLNKFGMFVASFNDENDWFLDSSHWANRNNIPQATHWRKLPNPPCSENANSEQ